MLLQAAARHELEEDLDGDVGVSNNSGALGTNPETLASPMYRLYAPLLHGAPLFQREGCCHAAFQYLHWLKDASSMSCITSAVLKV